MAEQRTGDPLPDETKAPVEALKAMAQSLAEGRGDVMQSLIAVWELGYTTARLEAVKGPKLRGRTCDHPRPDGPCPKAFGHEGACWE